MKTIVQKWGNSLALRIPKAVSDDLGIANGAAVRIFVDDGLLIVTSLTGRKARLQRMLQRITSENLPNENEAFGRAVGREQW